MPRNSRRSTSMGMNSLLLQDTSPTSVMGSSARPVLPPFSTRTSGMISGLPTSLRETAPLTMSPGLATQKNEGYFPPIMPVVMEQISDEAIVPISSEVITTTVPINPEDAAVPPPSSAKSETTPSDPPAPPPSTRTETTLSDPPAESPVPESSTTQSIPMAPTMSASQYRRSSRSTLSPRSRDTPLFAPSSVGRPASVASSHSAHSRGLPIGIPGGKSAPAMAITSSTGSGNFSSGSQGRTVARPPSDGTFSLSQRDGSSGTGTGTGSAAKGSPLGIGTASAASNSTSSGLSSMARTISRGFSIKPQNSTSGASSSGSAGGGTGKPSSAADILKKYGESK
jgi:hypothetical protein